MRHPRSAPIAWPPRPRVIAPLVALLALLLAAPLVRAASLGDTLRTLATQAAAGNPVTAAPLRPAPAWAASTAYELGVVVEKGSKLYICRASGTSAASGGPSGTGSPGMYADISDGSVTWEYYGTPVTTVADAAAPLATAQVNPPGSLDTYHSPMTGGSPDTASYRFAGGNPVQHPGNPGTQLAFPCVTINGSGTGGNVGLDDGHSDYHWSATFVTDAPVLAIGVSYAPTAANIIIDGRRLFPGGWQGVSGGNPSHFVLDFTAAGGRRSRTITIEDYGNICFAGVWTDAASTLTAPVIATPIRVAVFGSSIECGGNGFPLRADLGWPTQIGKLLGWHDVRNLGLGGTGYINNQGGSSRNYGEHIADATAIAPDLVIVGGPINDETQPPATLQAAAATFLGQLRSALPNAPIVALGTFPAASGPSTQAIDAENAIAAAVSGLGDPRIFFVPLCTAAGGSFITGTGNVGSPTGSGNADLYISDDGTHPDQPGIDFIAATYAAKIKALVVDHLDAGPTLSSFAPASGPVGTTVTLTGTGLTGATAVAFNGTAATFAVLSSTSIEATVPAGATDGAIAVTTPEGTATSAAAFDVTDGGGSGDGSGSGHGGGAVSSGTAGSGCGLGSGAVALAVLLLAGLRGERD